MPMHNREAEANTSVERLHDEFIYSPTAGALLHRRAKYGGGRIFALQPAGHVSCHGYLLVGVGRRKFRAHRVIWAMHYGAWPDGEIDHINRVKNDNRIANLRVVTHAENANNIGLRANNTSGITGVSWCKSTSRWQVTISPPCIGRNVGLGRFDNLADAALVRRVAEHCYFGGVHAFAEDDAAQQVA